jgi:phytoene dehydrogenase-like protein
VDLTDVVERQIERFAPGFRDRILARHVMCTADLQAENPNYVGGAITGGVADLDFNGRADLAASRIDIANARGVGLGLGSEH